MYVYSNLTKGNYRALTRGPSANAMEMAKALLEVRLTRVIIYICFDLFMFIYIHIYMGRETAKG